MNITSITCVVLVGCLAALVGCASEVPNEESSTVAPVESDLAPQSTYHYGKCAIDANNNLTGNCLFTNNCGGQCKSLANAACPVGTHITDPVDFLCDGGCGLIVKSKVSSGHTCNAVY